MILFGTGIFFGLLALAELILRLFGFIPGYIGAMDGQYLDLKKVDHLESYNWFKTDSLGIWKANPDTVFYAKEIQINPQGFRGQEFKFIDTNVTKVLLIGDSFTWGGNADPITNSFSDLLAKKDFLVYNSGIPGADPNQYAKIAERYIPELKPDKVVVVFYLENDVMYYKWENGPNQPRYHITNAGWLNPFVDGDYLGDAHQTWEYYWRRFSIPVKNGNTFNVLSSKTVLGTWFWMFLVKKGWIEEGFDPDVIQRRRDLESRWRKEPVSKDYLDKIESLSADNGAQFFLVLVRTHTRLGENLDQTLPGLFGDLKVCECKSIAREDYHEWPDGHFNNAGHQKMAECLGEWLDN